MSYRVVRPIFMEVLALEMEKVIQSVVMVGQSVSRLANNVYATKGFRKNQTLPFELAE